MKYYKIPSDTFRRNIKKKKSLTHRHTHYKVSVGKNQTAI